MLLYLPIEGLRGRLSLLGHLYQEGKPGEAYKPDSLPGGIQVVLVPEIVRWSRKAPAFGIIRQRDHLNRMFLEQLHREDYRRRTVIDIGTGTGRVVWEIAARAHRVLGVDREEKRLME